MTTTYDEWPYVSPEGSATRYLTSADSCAPSDTSGRCDVYQAMTRCALDVGHAGPCRTMGALR